MKNIFFVYGSIYIVWGVHRRNDHHSFSINGIFEIDSITAPSVLEKAEEIILEGINQKKIDNKITSGCRPHENGVTHIGGSWTEFHAEFFSNDSAKKVFIGELNIGLKNVLEKVFKPNNK